MIFSNFTKILNHDNLELYGILPPPIYELQITASETTFDDNREQLTPLIDSGDGMCNNNNIIIIVTQLDTS